MFDETRKELAALRDDLKALREAADQDTRKVLAALRDDDQDTRKELAALRVELKTRDAAAATATTDAAACKTFIVKMKALACINVLFYSRRASAAGRGRAFPRYLHRQPHDSPEPARTGQVQGAL